MSEVIAYPDMRRHRRPGRAKPRVFFDRQEMRLLLSGYSRRVASGEWRDYAIDQRSGAAVFSIFRHTYDAPLFAIVKRHDGRNCEYLVFNGPRKLKQSSSMAEALSVFDRPLRLVHRMG